MGFTQSQVIESARLRVGNKADVGVGDNLVPDAAIIAEMRDRITECCRAFGATGVSKEKYFRTVRAAAVATPAAPTLTAGTSGGLLAAGTYSYRVAAICGPTQTITGAAATVTTSGSTGKVTVSWAALAGATGYVVYGRTAGAERYLFETDGNTLEWIDTGRAAPADDPATATDSGDSWLQDYDLATYVGDDVLEVQRVSRSGAFIADDVQGASAEIDARGVRVAGLGGFVTAGFQQEVQEVIAGQQRWRHANRFTWDVIRRGSDLLLRLEPPPQDTEVVAVSYLSTASSISALPDTARGAVELAACAAIINCLLNRVPDNASWMITGQSERRDRQEMTQMLERQRDRYDKLFLAAVGRGG